MAIISRRALITSAAAALFAPAIVRASSLMTVPALTWREARRATRLTVSSGFGKYTVEELATWVHEKMMEEMMKLIENDLNTPVYYTDAPWKPISDIASKIAAEIVLAPV